MQSKATPRAVAVFLVALLLALGATTVVASPASASTSFSTAEADFFRQLNAERTARGLAPLQNDGYLANTSRSWSINMMQQNRLYHDPNLAAAANAVEPRWQTIGENVGVGYSVSSLHSAFMGSTGHRDNILSSRYNRVGIGVTIESGGKIWVTVRFLQGPNLATTSTTSTATAPPPPSARPSALTGDFNGDGFDDVFQYAPGTGSDELHLGSATGSFTQRSTSVRGHYQPFTGDFDGDGRTEIFWYAAGSASDIIWEWDGDGFASTGISVRGEYEPVTGDFNGDGHDDIVWYGPGRSSDILWFGTTQPGQFVPGGFRLTGTYRVAAGDLDGDGRSDLVLHGPGSRSDVLLYGESSGTFAHVGMSVRGDYTPVVADFDGDQRDDVLWYGPGSKSDAGWRSIGGRGTFEPFGRTVRGTYLPADGDFDGNRADDVLWYSPASATGDPMWWGTGRSTTYAAATLR